MSCRKCEYFIFDSSTDTSDCAKCDEVNEADVDCFEDDTEGCPCYKEYDGKAEYDYYKSLGVIL